jgi:hypothetical protein
MSVTETVLGMAWYTPEAWARLKAIPEARVDMSYRAYVRNYDAYVRRFVAEGIKVERVAVDVDQMLAWCHRNGYAVDTTGRAIFSTVLTMARDDPRVLDNPIVDNVTRSVQ